MNEDISAQIRLSISISCTAQLIMVVVNLMIIGMVYLNMFQTKIITGVQTVNSSIATSITAQEDVSAATVYKFCRSTENRISSAEILYLDGSLSTNWNDLLQRPSMRVSVVIDELLDGQYYIRIKEVD